MATTTVLTENSRQGINFQIPLCVGIEARLSRDLRLGCGHAYDETPVGIVVYVRNDPVNKIDPDGRLEESWWAKNGGDWWEPHEANPELDPLAPLHEPSGIWGQTGAFGPTVVGSSLSLDALAKKGVVIALDQSYRQSLVATVIAALPKRLGDPDCNEFLMNVIQGLQSYSGGSLLSNSISKPADLINSLNQSTIHLYGVVDRSTNLGTKRGDAFADSGPSDIYLGEKFFYTSEYAGRARGRYLGGDQVSTMIHELLQVGFTAANGKGITDPALDGIVGSRFGAWGTAVSQHCGPKLPN